MIMNCSKILFTETHTFSRLTPTLTLPKPNAPLSRQKIKMHIIFSFVAFSDPILWSQWIAAFYALIPLLNALRSPPYYLPWQKTKDPFVVR